MKGEGVLYLVKYGSAYLPPVTEEGLSDLQRNVVETLANEGSMMDYGRRASGLHTGKSALIGALLGAGAMGGLGTFARMNAPWYGNKPSLEEILMLAAGGAGAGAIGGAGVSKLNQIRHALGYNDFRQALIDAIAYEKGTHPYGSSPGSSNPEVYDVLRDWAQKNIDANPVV